MTHTLYPGFIPEGYFYQENVAYIKDKIIRVLKREYKQEIIIDDASIVRIMDRVINERLESIPRMNQRVIMYITSEFRQHQLVTDRNLKWSAHFWEGSSIYDASTERGPDTAKFIRPNYLGIPKVGGTLRFHFT